MKFIFAPILALSTSVATAGVFLNEIRIDQPGGDNDEYVELFSDSPGSDSIDGLSLIVIGDGAGGSGVIENVTSFAGITNAFDTNPYFLAAEASFSIGVADFTTELSFENSDNVTFALVNGFTGMNGDDLDTDDDGVLDATPWSSVVDALGLQETVDGLNTDGGEWGYGSSLGDTLGPDGTFVPGHAYRVGNAPGDWAIGAFGLDDNINSTPGASNAVIPEPSSALLALLGLAAFLRRRR